MRPRRIGSTRGAWRMRWARERGGIYYPPLAIRELRELCRERHALAPNAADQAHPSVLLQQGIADDRSLATLALTPRAAASVAALRQVLAAVRHEVAQTDAEVQQISAPDPIAQDLQRLRGIGPVLAPTIRAEIGHIRRFPSGPTLASYAGLVPRVDGECGARPLWAHHAARVPWLRWALIEAAMHKPRRSDRVGRWWRAWRWRASFAPKSTGAGSRWGDILSRAGGSSTSMTMVVAARMTAALVQSDGELTDELG